MSIDSISSPYRSLASSPGAVASRPVEERYRVSRGADLADRGFHSLFIGGAAAYVFGGVTGLGVAMVSGSRLRGLAAGAAVGALMLTGGLAGAMRSKPQAYTADPESVALAWVPGDGDPNGPYEMVARDRPSRHQTGIGNVHLDTGSAFDYMRRGEAQLKTQPGEWRAYEKEADAIAYARAAPGDQAVLRQDPYGAAPRWLVTELDVTAAPSRDPQYRYRAKDDRPEFLVPPGAAPDRDLRVPASEWLRSVPYGVDFIASFKTREQLPLVEFGGRELVPAAATNKRSWLDPDTYLVGRPD